MWILQNELPQEMGIFIDDGGIEGPQSKYNDEVLEENEGIGKFIWDYAVILESALFSIEKAGPTVSGKMLSPCFPESIFLVHVVGYHGRTVSERKRKRISKCPVHKDLTEVGGFVCVCVYLRMLIQGFAEIYFPLRRLKRKDPELSWASVCQDAFDQLKGIVGRDVLLADVSYGEVYGL